MSLTNAAELDLLQLLLQNTDWANIGDAGGLQNSATAGSLYIALCDGDPGETGDLVTNELTLAEYGQYARVAVARSGSGWDTDGGNGLDNASAISFAQMTTGTGVTATHFAICTGSTIATDDAILYGALDSSLAISSGITPEFAAGALNVTAD